MPEQIRIETGGRWDTLELVRRLPRCRWYLVERESRRWDVHVEARSAALLVEVVDAAERLARDRHVRFVVHLPSPDNRRPAVAGTDVPRPGVRERRAVVSSG